jgi:hypothetical protein
MKRRLSGVIIGNHPNKEVTELAIYEEFYLAWRSHHYTPDLGTTHNERFKRLSIAREAVEKLNGEP